MNNIKFSILIPAYKSRFLKDTIESCIRQSYTNLELIIVDDASPEDLESIVHPYLTDQRVMYYRNEKNCGAEHVVDNWNICLAHCTGDWVICMGDDDMLMTNCLEEYAKAIATHSEVDALHARVRLIDEKGQLISILSDRADYESAYSCIIHRLEGRRQYIGDFCYRTERLRKEGGYYNLPFAWGSDDITSYICASPNGICNINTPTFCYRMNRYTISNSGNEEKKLIALALVRDWLYGYVEKQRPTSELEQDELKKIKNLVERSFINTQGFLIGPIIKNNPFMFFKWIAIRKKYSLSIKSIIKGTIRQLLAS